MRLRDVLVVLGLTLGCFQNVLLAEELGELTEMVRDYSRRYAESLSNLRCDVEGVSAGVSFTGKICLLNRVLPYRFPKDGAFSFSSRAKPDSSDPLSTSEIVKVGNPQYSFIVSHRESNQTFGLDDFGVQVDNFGRKDILKDPVFFSFSAIDSAGLFAPVMVFDIPSIELLEGDRGVQGRKASSDDTDWTVVEFQFPKEHPFQHEWARVTFGTSGQVLHYELKNRAEPQADVVYTYTVRYSDTEMSPQGCRFPVEVRVSTLVTEKGQPHQLQENWYKLSNFEIGRNSKEQFTLTNYGIPEPEGTTVLGRPIPYWLLGTIAGVVFLGMGLYLRKRSE